VLRPKGGDGQRKSEQKHEERKSVVLVRTKKGSASATTEMRKMHKYLQILSL